MACTIIATAGGASSNSYCTIAEADAYHETHVSGATWAAATEDQKCRALQTATRLLETHVSWLGEPTTTAQRLGWPRQYMTWIPGTCECSTNPGYVDSTVVPEQVKYAVSEYARFLLTNDPTALSETELEGLASVKASDMTLVFRSPLEAAVSSSRSVVPGSVYAFITPWISATTIAKTLQRI